MYPQSSWLGPTQTPYLGDLSPLASSKGELEHRRAGRRGRDRQRREGKRKRLFYEI